MISRVPEDMTIEQALLVEPYGCSKHAVDRGSITNEDVVVISGAGTLGLGMITYARMKKPEAPDRAGYEGRSSGKGKGVRS